MVLAIAMALVFVYAARLPILRQLGGALVHSDPLAAADVIVVTLDSGSAGALEAADLVRAGVAPKVAVFTDPPSKADLELAQRGLPHDDRTTRQIDQLALLGMRDVLRIPAPVSGTTDEVDAMPRWCAEQGFRTAIVVATTDHSRRLRRVLARSTAGPTTRFSVRPSRYSAFDPDRWWEQRNGTRIAIVELQKLALDVVTHPLD